MRRPDLVKIELVKSSGIRGELNNFTSFKLTNDITCPTEAAFEIGDDGTWDKISDFVLPGTQYRVHVNGRLRMTGRVELDDIPLDPASGATVRFTVRTKLADANFASADPRAKVTKTSVKDFILRLYDPLGYKESDFVFDPATARDLMTGVASNNKGSPVKIDLEDLKLDQAKPNPPETIFGAADRHLRRHGLMHWDSPDGKIVVSAPNDSQDPIYHFAMFRQGKSRYLNNVMRAQRTLDYSTIPGVIGVYGVGGQFGFSKARVSALAEDKDVQAAGFYRPVMIVAEGIKLKGVAERAAARELSARSKGKDAWDLLVDGLSFWDGSRTIPFGIDTVAEVITDVAGGPLGAYYVYRCILTRDAQNGDTAQLSLLRRGIWKI